MKRSLIPLFLLLTLSAFSQTKSEADYITDIAQRICERIAGSDYSGLSSAEREAKLGLEMIGALSDVEGAFEALNLNFSDEGSMEAFGERVGLKLVSVCPEDFISLLNEEMLEASLDETVNYAEIEGTLSRNDQDAFAGFKLEADDGSSFQLLWLEHFEGEDLIAEKVKSQQTYRVLYEEIELYDPNKKRYSKRKVIRGIEEL